MRLYKYVPIDRAINIVKTNQVVFSKSSYFNDPFDTPKNPYVPDYGIFGSLTAEIKSTVWRQNTAILCLTRTAVNPLMWAHYSAGHTGAVLAFDAAKSGFLSEQENMIPAHFGSVVYLQERNIDQYISHSNEGYVIGQTYNFRLDHFEKLQRLFLSNPIYWAYEEEVRVVKCIASLPSAGGRIGSGNFSVIKANDRELQAFHLPEGAIESVYLGIRCENRKVADLVELIGTQRLRRCFHDGNSYTVQHREFEDYSFQQV